MDPWKVIDFYQKPGFLPTPKPKGWWFVFPALRILRLQQKSRTPPSPLHHLRLPPSTLWPCRADCAEIRCDKNATGNVKLPLGKLLISLNPPKKIKKSGWIFISRKKHIGLSRKISRWSLLWNIFIHKNRLDSDSRYFCLERLSRTLHLFPKKAKGSMDAAS